MNNSAAGTFEATLAPGDVVFFKEQPRVAFRLNRLVCEVDGDGVELKELRVGSKLQVASMKLASPSTATPEENYGIFCDPWTSIEGTLRNTSHERRRVRLLFIGEVPS